MTETTDTPAAERAITITNRGPIRELSIPVPEGGGVVVLEGHNGAGKTAALMAVDELLTGTNSPFGRRDGALKATTEGLGASVALAQVRRRTGGSALEVVALSGVDPSIFVDPPVKDPAAADRARLQALVRLAKVEASLEDFAEVAGGMDALVELLDGDDPGSDPITLAAAVRRALQAAARDAERELDEAKGRVEGLRAKAGTDLEPGETDPQVLDAALEAATTALAEARAARKAGLERQEAAERARAELDGMGPAPDLEELTVARDAAAATVAILEQRLEVARETHRQAESDLREGQGIAQARASAERVIQSAQGAHPPSEEEIEAREAAREDAVGAVEHGALLRQAAGFAQQLRQQEGKLVHLERDAERLRESAKAVDGVLSTMLSRGNLEGYGFRVVEDRLVLPTERGDETPVSELSTGQRYSLAVPIAVAGHDPADGQAMLVLRQEAFEGLDPENRARLDAIAKEHNCVILTAQASDGDLRARVLT